MPGDAVLLVTVLVQSIFVCLTYACTQSGGSCCSAPSLSIVADTKPAPLDIGSHYPHVRIVTTVRSLAIAAREAFCKPSVLHTGCHFYCWRPALCQQHQESPSRGSSTSHIWQHNTQSDHCARETLHKAALRSPTPPLS